MFSKKSMALKNNAKDRSPAINNKMVIISFCLNVKVYL